MKRDSFVDLRSRGPHWNEMVRSNYVLGRRMAKRQGFTISGLDGRLAHDLSRHLEKNGPPAERTVRDWVRRSPELPELALRAGAITREDILPWLRLSL